MKYFAINCYVENAWVEEGEYNSFDEAERDLARNNPQVILNENEMFNIICEVLRKNPKMLNQIMNELHETRSF